jgi:hypothetical protein
MSYALRHAVTRAITARFGGGMLRSPDPGGYGPDGGWAWSYTTAKDACGSTEKWTSAGFDNGGQSTTAPYNTDITIRSRPGACTRNSSTGRC